MADNVQKTPLARTLEQFGNRKAAGAIALLGKALPAQVVSVSGSIVTVKFLLTNVPFTLPNIKCPIAGSQWARAPTQVDDLGVVLACDAYIGGVSGLGGGTADLTPPANLSALVFFPVGNSGWTAPADPNSWEIYGPDGAIIRTQDSTSSVQVSSAGTAIKLPTGKSVTITTLPVAPTGPGSLWNNGGVVNVV
jgi:hypothetical protein